MRLILLLLCLLLPLNLAAQTADQPTGTIAIEDSATTDAAIANRIRDILRELEGYGDVSVTVSSGIVTLRGTTLDLSSATRLNDLVGRVAGVVAIENEVQEGMLLASGPALTAPAERTADLRALLGLAEAA